MYGNKKPPTSPLRPRYLVIPNISCIKFKERGKKKGRENNKVILLAELGF